MSLADLHRQMEEQDTQVFQQEKVASETPDDMVKLAQEYDAAGRIMARGFYDEFNSLVETYVDGE